MDDYNTRIDQDDSRWERGRKFLLLSIPILTVLVIAYSFVARVGDSIVFYVGLVGAVYGVAMAVYDRFEPGGDSEAAGWALLIYPIVLYIPMHFVGLLMLALYNLVFHGSFVLNL